MSTSSTPVRFTPKRIGESRIARAEREFSRLTANEKTIVQELLSVQGNPVDVGGYYQPDDAKASAALRPSKTLNDILATH